MASADDDLNNALKRANLQGDIDKLCKANEYKAAIAMYQKLLDLQTDDIDKLNTLLLQAQCGAMLRDELESYEQKVFDYIVKCRMDPKIALQRENYLKKDPIAAMVLYSSVSRMYINEADAAEKIFHGISKIFVVLRESMSQVAGTLVLSIGGELFERMIDRLLVLDNDGKDEFILEAARITDQVSIAAGNNAMINLELKLAQKMLQVLEKTFKKDCQNYYVYGRLLNQAGVASGKSGPKAEAARYFHRAIIAHSKAKDVGESERRKGMDTMKSNLDYNIGSLPPEERERVAKEVSDTLGKLMPTTPASSEKTDRDGEVGETPEGESKDSMVDVGGGIFVNLSKPLRENHSVFYGKIGGLQPEVAAVKMVSFSQKHLQEVKLMLDLKEHTNTVRYKTSTVSENLRLKSIFFAMELCDRETLYEIVKHEKLSERQRVSILLQISHGLQYVHENNIVHGDLKPQNILLSLDGKNIKIADFGLSKKLDEGKSQITKTGAGTEGWMAPDEKASAQSDIYSAGLVFLYVLSGELPAIEGGKVSLVGIKLPTPRIAEHLITSMLQQGRSQRPSATKILKHPLFWDDDKKLQFLCDVSDCLSPLPNHCELIKLLDQKSSDVSIDWHIPLALEAEEVPDIQDVPKKSKSKLVYDKAIKEKAGSSKRGKPEYDHKSLYSLLKFIRNRYHHYLDDGAQVQKAFGSQQGIWRFMAGRFPKLFFTVYDFTEEELVGQEHTKDASAKALDPTKLLSYYEDDAMNKPLKSLWTAERRLKFIKVVSKREDLLAEIAPNLERFLKKSWIEGLVMSDYEVAKFQKRVEDSESRIKICQYPVFNVAITEVEAGKETYNEKSIESLFQFIKIRTESREKESQQLRLVFESDRDIWDFFSRRHPGLFEAVHELVEKDRTYSHIMSEVHVAS